MEAKSKLIAELKQSKTCHSQVFPAFSAALKRYAEATAVLNASVQNIADVLANICECGAATQTNWGESFGRLGAVNRDLATMGSQLDTEIHTEYISSFDKILAKDIAEFSKTESEMKKEDDKLSQETSKMSSAVRKSGKRSSDFILRSTEELQQQVNRSDERRLQMLEVVQKLQGSRADFWLKTWANLIIRYRSYQSNGRQILAEASSFLDDMSKHGKVLKDIHAAGETPLLKKTETVDKSVPVIEKDIKVKKHDRQGVMNEISKGKDLKSPDTVQDRSAPIIDEATKIKPSARPGVMEEIRERAGSVSAVKKPSTDETKPKDGETKKMAPKSSIPPPMMSVPGL